jgi:hypothetical protein
MMVAVVVARVVMGVAVAAVVLVKALGGGQVVKGKRLAENSFPNKIWMAGNRPSWRERKDRLEVE